jgi:hypothetical protein
VGQLPDRLNRSAYVGEDAGHVFGNERNKGLGEVDEDQVLVAAYLASLDISGFNPKAPPPKTPAFWAIVANRAPEDAELADVLDGLGNPNAQ